MLNVKKLQAIRDRILGVTVDPRTYGDLNSVVYLQQILDAVSGVASTPARTRGNLAEHIYLQKILNAKLGVADGQFGSLSNSIYLQQIINAINGVTSTKFGSLSENSYLDALYAVAGSAAAWYLRGGIPAANCVAAYQAKAAASLLASYTNLAHPGTNNAGLGVAPTWDATTGWTFNGTTQFLTTGLVPASGWSMVVRYSNASITVDNLTIAGTFKAGSRFEVCARSSNTVVYASGNFLQVTPKLQTGILGIAGQQGYRNGVADGAAIGAWTTSGPPPILIGDRGGAASKFSGNIQALAFYNAVLSPAQMLAVTTAMAAL